MSIDSVFNNCIENSPDINKEALLEDINKQMRRFEKVVKSSYNESNTNFFRSFSDNYVKVRDETFNAHKMEEIHRYLTMLIDLYDYKVK